MRELARQLGRWVEAGTPAVVGRVVDTDGSGPRAPGAAMAVSADGEVIGSVSGGCVEGAVVTEALEVLASRRPRVVSFGYSDDEAFAVGLTCGGTVHVFLAPLDLWLEQAGSDVPTIQAALADALENHEPVALVTVIDGPGVGATRLVGPDRTPLGTLGDVDLDRVATDALGQLVLGTSEVRHYGEHGEAREAVVSVFIESFAPPPRMFIFGAVDFTAALAHAAKLLGYHVTVCDAREVFATRRRFPMADDVVVEWPNRFLEHVQADTEVRDLGAADAVCILTHDHKFDVPAVVAALATGVGYIGAMGSRRTHADRDARLRELGVTDEQLARVHSPIGLDLGARTPEEVAVAVLAEIIAVNTGRAVPSLRDATGPLH